MLRSVVAEPRRSPTWLGLCLGMLAAVVILLPATHAEPALAVTILVVTGAAVVVALRAGGWLGGAAPPAVSHAEGRWRLRHPDTRDWLPVTLRADGLVSTRLLILRFDGVGRRPVSVPLFADAVDADTHRRLRVILRWGADGRPLSAAPG